MTPGTTVLGPYALHGRIGEGGMGVVHLAAPLAEPGRYVALKELRPGVLGDEESLARLAREVDSLRRVRSPRVAEVLDADVTGRRPYVVTRFVRGRSLDHHVKEQGPLPQPLQRRLAVGLLDALADVHAAGVVHRDVKPGNVMLVEDGGVVLIDFGLARAADSVSLTRTGFLAGTPGYLAPEVVAGRPSTAATDVHGWAATLAYAASGVPPYGEGSVVEVVARISAGQSWLSGLDPVLEPLVRSGLSVDPAHRLTLPQLRALLAEPTSAPPAEAAAPVAVPAPVREDDDTAVIGAAVRTRVDVPAQPDRVGVGARAAEVGTGAGLLPRPAPFPLPPTGLGSGPTPGPPPRALTGAVGPPSTVPASLVEPGAATGAAALTLVGAGAVVTAAVAVAPYAGLLLLGVGLLAARTADRLRLRLLQRRVQRGPRAHDGRVLAAEAPLRALLSLPSTLLQLAGLAVAAGLAGVLAQLVLPWPQAPLPVAGATAALLAWWGPGAGRVRRGGRVAVAPLRDGGLPAWVIAGSLLAVAWSLAVVAEQYAAIWWPASGGPGLPSFL